MFKFCIPPTIQHIMHTTYILLAYYFNLLSKMLSHFSYFSFFSQTFFENERKWNSFFSAESIIVKFINGGYSQVTIWTWYEVDRSTNTRKSRNNIGTANKIFYSAASRGEKLDLIKDAMTLIPYWDKSNFFVQKEGEILIINYLLWPSRIAASKYVQFMFV